MPAFPGATVPGAGTVEGNLVALAHAALSFYLHGFPMMASMVAQPRLMAATRESLAGYGAGPQYPVRMLADYLAAEQGLGRIPAEAAPEAVSALLMGACFQQAFLRYFDGGPDFSESVAIDLVRGLLPALTL
jgi:hypothetical protein